MRYGVTHDRGLQSDIKFLIAKMMNIGLHCRIAGRPSRAVALQKFLEYARSFPNVWFARRIDIARWWQEKHP